MRVALDRIARMVTGGSCNHVSLPWHLLRYQHTTAIRSRLKEELAPGTVNKYLSALRGVLKEAGRLNLIDGDSWRNAVDVRSIKAESLPSGRMLGRGELLTLFDQCAKDAAPAGARDSAILAIMLAAGLRRAEVVALDLGDFSQDTGELRILRSKGRKDRLVYATNGATDALLAWISVRGNPPGPLFVPIRKDGVLLMRRMTDQAVYAMLRKRARKAGIASFSPHDLRRTFISEAIDNGADLFAVQQLAGHASIQTTTRYDRRGEQAKKKAAECVHVPYVPWVGAASGEHPPSSASVKPEWKANNGERSASFTPATR